MTEMFSVGVGLSAVVIAVTDDRPRVLTVDGPVPSLPTGALDLRTDGTLERGLRRLVVESTGVDLGYVEQLYTFGDAGRGGDPGVREIAVAYLGLVREGSVSGEASWRDLYEFLPWEDMRDPPEGPPWEAGVGRWIEAAPDDDRRTARRERATIVFRRGESAWDVERVLERYEMLYEIGVLPESGGSAEPVPGTTMALDHRRVLAQALGRVRGKLQYRPVVFELMPGEFTLRDLQRVVEALAGIALHTQNFRRLLETTRVVEGVGRYDSTTGGRPAELYRFRREVVLERPAPGVGLPGMPTSG